MSKTLQHPRLNTDLEKAKDGRWVMLVGLDVGAYGEKDGPGPDDNHIPAVITSKWVEISPGVGYWTYLWASGQGEGFCIQGAEGFVELSDLGFV